MAKDSATTRTSPQMLFDSATELLFSRGLDYGHYEDNLNRISIAVSAYLGIEVKPSQIANIMVLVKVMRSVESPRKLDNYVDAIAYLGMVPDLIQFEDGVYEDYINARIEEDLDGDL